MHDQFLCSQSLHGVVRNWHYLNGKVSWVYEMYIWGKYIPNKQGLILSLKTNTAFCFLWVTWLFISGDMNQVLDNISRPTVDRQVFWGALLHNYRKSLSATFVDIKSITWWLKLHGLCFASHCKQSKQLTSTQFFPANDALYNSI